MSNLKDKYINPLTSFGLNKRFEAAEVAKFTSAEREAYEESLKHYRDIKNIVDTSKAEGREEGRAEGKEEERYKIARALKGDQIPWETIQKATGLSLEEIEKL